MSVMSRLYPCQDCAEDLRADLVTHPPRVTSSEEFSQWMCEMHNRSENYNILGQLRYISTFQSQCKAWQA